MVTTLVDPTVPDRHGLPSALVIGVPKAGTSWLQLAASKMNDVCVPRAKDTYFFCDDTTYARGLAWYQARFAPRPGQLLLEICHDYAWSDEARCRIAVDLPRVRIIVTLRRPGDRARSSYLNALRHGQITSTFDDALRNRPFLYAHSRYATMLAPWIKTFGRESVKVLDYEELRRDPRRFYDRFRETLGLTVGVMPPELNSPVRPAATARMGFASRVAKSLAMSARQLGLADTVGVVKSSDLVQKILYRSPEHVDEAVDPASVRRIDEELRGEVAHVDALLGTKLEASWYGDA